MGRALIVSLAVSAVILLGGCPAEVTEYAAGDLIGSQTGSNSGTSAGDSAGGGAAVTAGVTETGDTAGELAGDAIDAGGDSPAGSQPEPGEPEESLTTLRSEILALVNAERAAVGAAPLRLSVFLSNAAQDHAADMVSNAFFSHTGSDGSSVSDRATNAGYYWSWIGENIAYGPSDPALVMSMWMNSSGHRSNILNTQFEEIGVGIDLRGTPYWVQVFGTPR